MKVLKLKTVSYGTVELVDNESTWARYHNEVNGQVKEVSEDLNYLVGLFNSKYY